MTSSVSLKTWWTSKSSRRKSSPSHWWMSCCSPPVAQMTLPDDVDPHPVPSSKESSSPPFWPPPPKTHLKRNVSFSGFGLPQTFLRFGSQSLCLFIGSYLPSYCAGAERACRLKKVDLGLTPLPLPRVSSKHSHAVKSKICRVCLC